MNRYLIAVLLCLGVTTTITSYCIASGMDKDTTAIEGSDITSVYVYGSEVSPEAEEETPMPVINNLPEGYEDKLASLLERNPDTADFVSGYATNYGSYDNTDLDYTSDPITGRVPLLMQWDIRWGFKEYGSDAMGFTGCGPTCLSMVAAYILDDPSMTPAYIADFAIENGYCVEGFGTAWDLMEIGSVDLGLDVVPITVDNDRIIANLEAGYPIIAIMGPGNFTNEGHFIVFTGVEDGQIVVNDPNSIARSERLWDLEEISDQIQALWVFRTC